MCSLRDTNIYLVSISIIPLNGLAGTFEGVLLAGANIVKSNKKQKMFHQMFHQSRKLLIFALNNQAFLKQWQQVSILN